MIIKASKIDLYNRLINSLDDEFRATKRTVKIFIEILGVINGSSWEMNYNNLGVAEIWRFQSPDHFIGGGPSICGLCQHCESGSCAGWGGRARSYDNKWHHVWFCRNGSENKADSGNFEFDKNNKIRQLLGSDFELL
jgi:hypothetical protein